MIDRLVEVVQLLPRLPGWVLGLWLVWIVMGILLVYGSSSLLETPAALADSDRPAHAENGAGPSPGNAADASRPIGPAESSSRASEVASDVSTVEVSFRWTDLPEIPWRRADVECTNLEGKKAHLKIFVSSQEFAWSFGSWEQTEFNGTPADFPAHLRSAGLKRQLESSMGIIAIGAASEEGSSREEYERSLERARQLVRWIREVVEEPVPLYSVSLGKHASTGKGISSSRSVTTSTQRSIVVVTITSIEEGFDFDLAVRASLAQRQLPFDLAMFPRFDLRSHS